MTEFSCEQCRDLTAEFALGVLDGRERANVLAHVDSCVGCRHDLAAMGDVADRLVELAPSAEPPAGFETEVLRRLTPRRPAAGSRLTVARLSIAAAAAVAVGIGGWAVGNGTTSQPSAAAVRVGGHIEATSFIVHGRPAGQVIAYGGPHPWVAMAVDSSLGNRTIRCDVVQRGGRVLPVGTFTLADGYGYWSAPTGVSPSSIAGVRLVDSTGKAVATATFERPAAT